MSLMIQSERHRFYHRKEIEMDFSAWLPSHTILVAITLLTFGVQLIVILIRLELKITKMSDKICYRTSLPALTSLPLPQSSLKKNCNLHGKSAII